MHSVLEVLVLLSLWRLAIADNIDGRIGCVTTTVTFTYGNASRKDYTVTQDEARLLVADLPVILQLMVSTVCGPFSTRVGLGPISLSSVSKNVELSQFVEIDMFKSDLYTLEKLKLCLEKSDIQRALDVSPGFRFGKIDKKEVTDIALGNYSTRDVCCRKTTCACGPGVCMNHALCTDVPTGFKCACLPGYGGKRCDKAVTLPVMSDSTIPVEIDGKVTAIILFVFLCLEGMLLFVAAVWYQMKYYPLRKSGDEFDQMYKSEVNA